MRPQDIKIGCSYRFRSSPTYGFAKAIKILKAKQGENPHNYCILKCIHSVNKNEDGQTRYFRPVDLIILKEIE